METLVKTSVETSVETVLESFVAMIGKPDGCILYYCRLGHGIINIPVASAWSSFL